MKTRSPARHLADRLAPGLGAALRQRGAASVAVELVDAGRTQFADRAALGAFGRRLRGRTARAAGLAGDNVVLRIARLARRDRTVLVVEAWRQ